MAHPTEPTSFQKWRIRKPNHCLAYSRYKLAVIPCSAGEGQYKGEDFISLEFYIKGMQAFAALLYKVNNGKCFCFFVNHICYFYYSYIYKYLNISFTQLSLWA